MVTPVNSGAAGPDHRRWWALGADTGQQQWTADAYVVVFAALMLPAGLLGDRFGRRRMLIAGLALSVLPSLFTPGKSTKAVGIVSAGSTLGDLPPLSASRAVDTVSTALTAGGLGALIHAIVEAPTRGWGDPPVLVTGAAAVVLITALVLRERRAARPMLDMSLLAQRGFLFNTLAATLLMFVLSGLLFVLPQYLQAVLGHDALGTGVRLLPMMGGLIIAARAAQPVVARFGARAVVSAGLVVLALAALLGSRTTTGSGYGFTALWLSIVGC
ncbi:hypothetical protein Saso_73610 [Streptomyces asoensis]|uniref:Major facilitator superfamily (MFS) profile domain-containing protein n=1 Tax=Streptomyces asoensis TaxID=249586 RepID=A0ABQ3SC72_9ACTN|nr:hypothetical protein GCM10010496_22520 [Streptomyces asoensis]GHI65711.1 hypothetical protein Saso_73610 [Streptomyces asoensis]